MKTVFMVPYFGKLPHYFQLFLDSCAKNEGFDWIVFTNDNSEFIFPKNVKKIEMSFSKCKELFQNCFDFEISLDSPQKLCDYKCSYGYVFDQYLNGYDWWGYCDIDQIFGKIDDFITEEMLGKYDKIGSLGHFTIYRNTPENNMVFMSNQRYREVFTDRNGCAFDEWLPGNINEIYIESNRPVLLENFGADVNSYKMAFNLVNYSMEKRRYLHSQVKNSVFLYENGELFQLFEENGELIKKEFPYVHLQKRKMKDNRKRNNKKFYIIPNSFEDGDNSPIIMLEKARRRSILNTQFFKVKWKSFLYRIKSGDWRFDNVFKQGG